MSSAAPDLEHQLAEAVDALGQAKGGWRKSMPNREDTPSRPLPDMSPEAIAARIRRVVELNRLCHSLGAAVPGEPPSPSERPAPRGRTPGPTVR